jgi:hypothetical protein
LTIGFGGTPIHGELLKLGFAVAQSTLAKYMTKNGHPSCRRSPVGVLEQYNVYS